MRRVLEEKAERQRKVDIYNDYMVKNIKRSGAYDKLKRVEILKGSA